MDDKGAVEVTHLSRVRHFTLQVDLLAFIVIR